MRRRNIHDILNTLDKQLVPFSPIVCDNLEITPEQSNRLASTIYDEVFQNSDKLKKQIAKKTPVPVDALLNTCEQAFAFNLYLLNHIREPGIIYAHFLSMNYIAFVYYRDNLFVALYNKMPRESAVRKCAKFLYKGDSTAAFRHAISHGNWLIEMGSAGDATVVYWARENDAGPMVRHEINQSDLVYLYTLSRSLTYACLSAISDEEQYN